MKADDWIAHVVSSWKGSIAPSELQPDISPSVSVKSERRIWLSFHCKCWLPSLAVCKSCFILELFEEKVGGELSGSHVVKVARTVGDVTRECNKR